jgi:hypothetical protein
MPPIRKNPLFIARRKNDGSGKRIEIIGETFDVDYAHRLANFCQTYDQNAWYYVTDRKTSYYVPPEEAQRLLTAASGLI